MSELSYSEYIRRVVATVAILVAATALVFLVVRLLPVLLLVFTSWVLSEALDVPVRYLQKRGMPRGVAIAITILVVTLLLVLLGLTIFPPLGGQIVTVLAELPAAGRVAVENYNEFRDVSPLLGQSLPEFSPAQYEALLQGTVPEASADGSLDRSDITDLINQAAGSALPLLSNVGGFFSSFIGNLVVVVFITLFILLEPITYYQGVVALFPRNAEERVIEVLNLIRQVIVDWLKTLAVSITFTGGSIAIILGVFLQIPNALALGVLAGIASIIPTIGPTLAIIPVIIFAATEGPVRLLLAILLYMAVGFVQDRLVGPYVVKRQMRIPAAAVLVFQVVAVTLLGFLGILLAVPLLSILIVITREAFVFDTLGKKDRLPLLADEERRLELTGYDPTPFYEEDDIPSDDEES